jgi:outer membrane protein assembly factor BamB
MTGLMLVLLFSTLVPNGIGYDTLQSKEIIQKASPSLYDGPMDSVWPMRGHDTNHTGRSPYSTADNSYIEKWRFFCSDGLHGCAVIDNEGIIYFPGRRDNRYCLFAVYPDGSEKWRFKISSFRKSPSIGEDGTIYIGGYGDGILYAINTDGTLKWKYQVGGSLVTSPVIADDGSIYVSTYVSVVSNYLYAINSDGTEKWKYFMDGLILSEPCLGSDGTIFIGSPGDLLALNPDGTLRWKFNTGSNILCSPSIADDGTIYFSSYDQYFYAIYQDGTLRWKCFLGYSMKNIPSIAIDGTIYVAGGSKLSSVNPDGTIKWVFNLGEKRVVTHSSPAISADGTIYIGTLIDESEWILGGEIVAVNSNGTERWRRRVSDGWVSSSPVIGEDGTVYFCSNFDIYGSKGYLHAFGNIESNFPPDFPTINGNIKGKIGKDYLYKFVANDPDNNPVELYIDWGDGNSSWIDWFASDETYEMRHTWVEPGNYTIKAKVKDVMGEEGPWNEFMVTIKSKSRTSYDFDMLSFLERYPMLQRLLDRIG